MPTSKTRYTVNIEPEHAPAVKRRAKQKRWSVASYLEWLVLRDLGLITDDETAPAINQKAAEFVAKESIDSPAASSLPHKVRTRRT